MNTDSDNTSGSCPIAPRPIIDSTASGGMRPPAAWPSRRMSTVVMRIANKATKTPAAVCANSRLRARLKIMF